MVSRIFGAYEAIRRDYPIGEYLDDIKNTGVVASVYVQTNWEVSRGVEEVAWVQSIADE
jgi:predicted TIM-barrel fold metal-dependent hydrolase